MSFLIQAKKSSVQQRFMPILKKQFSKGKPNPLLDFSDILPETVKYNIPTFKKNPQELNFPLLIGGAPKLQIRVITF